VVGGKDSILSLRFSFYFSSLGYAGSFFSYLGVCKGSSKIKLTIMSARDISPPTKYPLPDSISVLINLIAFLRSF